MTTNSLQATIRFSRALWTTSAKSALALRATFFLQVAFMALNNFAFFTFWWALFRKVPSVRGWRIDDVALLYGVSAAGFGLAMIFAGGSFQLGRAIDEGELDPLLTQPKPTLLYAVGSHVAASGLGDFASGIALVVLSGKVSLARLPYLALALVASGLVYAASWTLYQSATFWLGRSEALGRMLVDATVTFSLYPEPLFGGALRVALFTLIPAGLVGFLPARLVAQPSLGGACAVLGSTIAYVAFASWVFRRGLRRYASGSRFGVFG